MNPHEPSIELDDARLEDEIFPPNLSSRIDEIRDLELPEVMAATERLERVEVLAEVTHIDPEPEVRARALQTLARIGSSDAYRVLDEARNNDPDRRVRTLAHRLSDERRRERQDQPPTPRHPGRTAFVTGIVNLAISYAPSVLCGLGLLIAGAASDSQTRVAAGWNLLIPLAGPPMAVISSETDIGYMGVAALNVILQTVGIAMLYVGLGRHLRRRRDMARSGRPSSGVTVAPVSTGQLSGVALMGVF